MHKTKQYRMPIWTSRGANEIKIGTKAKFFHYFRSHLNALRISFSNVASTPLSTLLIALAIGIGLSMPASLFVGVKNLRALAPDWSNQLIITVMLDHDASKQDAKLLSQRYQNTPYLKQHKVIDKSDALKEFEQQSGFKDISSVLPQNPLPHVLHFQFDTSIPLDTLESFKQQISQEPKVERLIYEREWVEKLQGIVRLGESLFDSLAILIALGLTFMIGTLIRLILERHREEVEVLNLIGATTHFIRRPFLYRGTLLGVLGGIVAMLLITFLLFGIEARANQVITLFNGLFTLKKFSFSDTLILLGTSALLGWLGAWLAFAHNQKSVA